ncbi:MAG: sialate O-acetylesterase, partial [Clostridiales bacterium]|nr:sialate O-acetylesterase [Clostridiales bacterium]
MYKNHICGALKKRSARACAALLCCALLSAGLFAVGFPHSQSASAAGEKPVLDVFLIAGQSNASGWSRISGYTNPTHAFTDIQSFGNVMYAGEAGKLLPGKSGNQRPYFTASAVTVGFGETAAHMGPEYGMAEVLNGRYDGVTKKALIVKSAAGGVSLNNTSGGNSALYGNYLPPSERENFTPNAATGVQYDNLVAVFERVYNEYKDTYDINVSGFAWMQGEDDRGSPVLYKRLIASFIRDIRSDLGGVVGMDLSEMPFVMGEISPTFIAFG